MNLTKEQIQDIVSKHPYDFSMERNKDGTINQDIVSARLNYLTSISSQDTFFEFKTSAGDCRIKIKGSQPRNTEKILYCKEGLEKFFKTKGFNHSLYNIRNEIFNLLLIKFN